MLLTCIALVFRYVRNTTARAFAVVASALGIPSLLPFLKAVCRSKKSWQVKIIYSTGSQLFLPSFYNLCIKTTSVAHIY